MKRRKKNNKNKNKTQDKIQKKKKFNVTCGIFSLVGVFIREFWERIMTREGKGSLYKNSLQRLHNFLVLKFFFF